MDAGEDIKALLAIMSLKGFGSSVDEDSRQQRAKRASAVLRMFNPKKWGVVDWRTAAMIWALNQKNWDVRRAISLVKADYPNRQKAKDEWDEIDEKIAAEVLNARYRANRSDSLQDAADVEMAVFGLSLVWAVNTKIRDTVRETYTKALRAHYRLSTSSYRRRKGNGSLRRSLKRSTNAPSNEMRCLLFNTLKVGKQSCSRSVTLLLSTSLLSVSDSWRSNLDHTVNFLISLWEIIKFIVINLLETPTVIPLSLTD